MFEAFFEKFRLIDMFFDFPGEPGSWGQIFRRKHLEIKYFFQLQFLFLFLESTKNVVVEFKKIFKQEVDSLSDLREILPVELRTGHQDIRDAVVSLFEVCKRVNQNFSLTF